MTSLLTRASRALSVSVVTTTLSASLLVALTAFVGVAAAVANVLATMAGVGPSYLPNRRWVWGRRGPSSLRREVVPFWVMALVALVASTVAVDRVAAFGAGWDASTRAVALPAAGIATCAALWLFQFALLDRALFRTPSAAELIPARGPNHQLEEPVR